MCPSCMLHTLGVCTSKCSSHKSVSDLPSGIGRPAQRRGILISVKIPTHPHLDVCHRPAAGSVGLLWVSWHWTRRVDSACLYCVSNPAVVCARACLLRVLYAGRGGLQRGGLVVRRLLDWSCSWVAGTFSLPAWSSAVCTSYIPLLLHSQPLAYSHTPSFLLGRDTIWKGPVQ